MHATAIIDADGTVTQSGSTMPVPWWSFTKTVLAIATLRLVEQGVLNLDDTLPGEPFTTRQLLRHESGLPDYGALPRYQADVAAGKPPWPIDRLLTAAGAAHLRTQPGTVWAYSNIGYLKIAQQIEHISGQPLTATLANLVFQPADLQSPRLALVPNDLADVEMGATRNYHPAWVYHGLIVGTLTDAARLLWLLATGALLAPATYATMLDRRSLPHATSPTHPDPAYGLGIMLSATNPQSHPIGHTGEGPGSKIAVYTNKTEAVAVWSSYLSPIDPEAGALELLKTDQKTHSASF